MGVIWCWLLRDICHNYKEKEKEEVKEKEKVKEEWIIHPLNNKIILIVNKLLMKIKMKTKIKMKMKMKMMTIIYGTI